MQKISNHKWEKLGLILKPNKDTPWCVSHTGSPYLQKENNKLVLYFTGRDKDNRSRIGKCELVLGDKPYIKNISKKPIVPLGQPGTFNEDGTSYPCLFNDQLYFTGWKKTRNVPFENNLGLAIKKGKKFRLYSRAPIFELSHTEPFGVGSVDIMKDTLYHCWYTAFTSWGTSKKIKHKYKIKYAYSIDGKKWRRRTGDCIDFEKGEYAICRPSVIYYNKMYHMVFCVRGSRYKLGYAYSHDKRNWERNDSLLQITNTPGTFDSKEMCYPHWFLHKNFLYLIYCGNDYGNEGIGIARLKL